MTQNITIFKNIKETQTPFFRNISEILNRIKEGSSKELIKSIRKEKNKSVRQELKKNLPAICFSGTFNKRQDTSLLDHSGFICLDFDGYEKQKDVLQEKERLTKDKYVYSVFISPSGNGLKVIVKIPQDVENHINYFNSLEKHFNSPNFDKTSKNVSRVCYESYDALLYLNENSQTWTQIEEIEYKQNRLVMFLNSPYSIHGVTKRSKTNFYRKYINIIGEFNFELFNYRNFLEK